jgi:hypothetical protein
MTRTNAGLMWVVAIVASGFVAVPAAAADGYQSLNSVTGTGADSGSYQSLNAVTGSEAAPSDSQSASSTHSTANAILADSPAGSSAPATASDDGYRTVSSVVGDQRPPSTLVEVRESSGFDWGDSLIGALVAVALMLMAGAAARLLSQQRRTASESRA